MKNEPQVTFTSNYFKPIPGEEEEANPGRFGKALALWLAERLKERGVPVEGVISEDWGWVVMVSRRPHLLWYGCGNVDDNEWRIFVTAELPLLQRLYKRLNAADDIERLRAHLAEIVPLIPEVRQVVWE